MYRLSVLAEAAAAAKKWRGLINIHKPWLYYAAHTNFQTCCRCHGNINSRCAINSYRAAWMLNQLRHGHRAWPCSS